MRQGLPFELFLGLRYLRSRGQRTNLSLFAWIGVGGVFLGVGALIVVLAVLPGDPVTVISPEGALTAVGMVPKMRRYIVAGMIEIGMHEYDSSMAYLSLPAAQEFAGIAGVTGIEVKLKDPFDAKVVGLAVAKLLGFRFWVRDWMEMNRSLLDRKS